MVSIHIFVAIVLLHTLFLSLLQLSCSRRVLRSKVCCKCLRTASKRNALITCSIAILRIMYTGFLEIVLSTYVGLGIFKLEEMTEVDILTAAVNIIYVFFLLIFLGVLLWFIFYKVRPLIHFKSARDQLEHLRIVRDVMKKLPGLNLQESMFRSDNRKFEDLRKAIVNDIEGLQIRSNTIRHSIANTLSKHLVTTGDQKSQTLAFDKDVYLKIEAKIKHYT